MVFFQLLSAAIGFTLEQLLMWRYGGLGVLALILLGVGVRTKDRTCLSASAVIFLLLMAQA
ncbi:hypothetical protein ACWGH2_38685 [Streptomyces sp. NPDC054871]